MNDKYHKRLKDKLALALYRCKFKIKTSITLDKHEIEDLYMLWKHKVPQKVFEEIFKKEMGDASLGNTKGGLSE